MGLPWYVGDRGVCAALTLVAAILLARGAVARPSRASRAAWIALIGLGVMNGLALNLQPANLSNGNLSLYYLGAKYAVPYTETYRLVQAAMERPQIGIRDLEHPGTLVRETESARRAYFIDLLRAARVPFDPLAPLEALAVRARDSGAVAAESRRILEAQLPQSRIEDFRRDVATAIRGAHRAPLTLDYGYNGSPLYGVLRQADPSLHVPYGPLAAGLNAAWQLLGVALLVLITGAALGFTLDQRLAAATLVVCSWDFTGFALPGLMFTELWVPIALVAWALRRRRAAAAGLAIAIAGLLKLFPFVVLLPALVGLLRTLAPMGRPALPVATRRWALTVLAAAAVGSLGMGWLATLSGRTWPDFLHKILVEFQAAPILINSANPAALFMCLGIPYGSPLLRAFALATLALLVVLLMRDDAERFHAALPRRVFLLMAVAGWLVKSWLDYYVVAPLLLVSLYARGRHGAAAVMTAAMAASYLLPEFDDPVLRATPWLHVLKLAPYVLLPAWLLALELGSATWGRLARRVAAGTLAVLALAAAAEAWRWHALRDIERRATAAFQDGRTAQALTDYRAWLRLSPGDVRARRHEGIALATLGRLDEALASFARAAATAPDDAAAHDDYGRALLMSGRVDEAAAQFEVARVKTPDDPQVLVMLARARLAQDRAADALPLLQRARALQPGDPQIEEALRALAPEPSRSAPRPLSGARPRPAVGME